MAKPLTTDFPCKGYNFQQTEEVLTCVGISIVNVDTSHCLQLLLATSFHSWTERDQHLDCKIVILEVKGGGPVCTYSLL